jgi:formylglycine-generating enzyme required for sulfatase activity
MTMKSVLPAIAALLLVTAIQPTEAGKRYAVVVGVKSYRPGQPLPELPFTENDADKLAETLRVGGYQVTLMTQTIGRTAGSEVMNPLSDYIRDQIDAVLDNPFLKDDDVVIVALAGHGVQYESMEGGVKTPQFYFCPGDADVRKLTTANEITDRNRLIDLQELYSGLKKCKAGGKLLLVDACRNDPTKPGITRSLASATLPPLPPPPGGTAAFFSCSAHQKAFEDADLKHGVFFHHVIKALQGEADSSTTKRPADGQITLAELSQHVSIETYDFVRRKFRGAKQAPELKGEFRLTVPLIEVKNDVITNSIGMKLKLIPAGEFLMGSPASEEFRSGDEGPQHRVKISKAFHLGTMEVSQAQWLAVMKTNPWAGKGFVKEGDSYPAMYVSWDDAVDFCKQLSEQEGRTYRLPTEAEWEYACRAGTTTAFSFGNSAGSLSEYAWWGGVFGDGNAKEEQYAHMAGTKRANAFGLHDMHGNVHEWCSDWYDAEYYGSSPVSDPSGPGSGSSRVLRGGSWYYLATSARSAYRSSFTPDFRDDYIGFRVVSE